MASPLASRTGALAAALSLAACSSEVSRGPTGSSGGATSTTSTSAAGTGGSSASATSSTSSSATTGTGGAPTASGTGGGYCGLTLGQPTTCAGADLCPSPVQIVFPCCPLPLVCPSFQDYGSCTGKLVDAAAAKCVLQKLRDQAIGNIHVGWYADNDYCGQDLRYYSFGDGTVGMMGGAFYGQAGSCSYEPARRVLQSQAWFDACLAATDDQTLIACVTNLTTCAPAPGPACPP